VLDGRGAPRSESRVHRRELPATAACRAKDSLKTKLPYQVPLDSSSFDRNRGGYRDHCHKDSELHEESTSPVTGSPAPLRLQWRHDVGCSGHARGQALEAVGEMIADAKLGGEQAT
jgi:hypothetical protein